MTKVEKRPIGTTRTGHAIDQFTLTNSSGALVRLINLGAAITHILVPDKNGRLGDVTLGWDSLRPYEENRCYFGVIVGRVGNRIARGRFTLDGVEHQLPINNRPNHLHGGPSGVQTRIWDVEIVRSAVRFSLLDPDGAEGYPGNVRMSVTYSWTDANALRLEYLATTDRPTPINLTNHAYFNLKDAGKTTILNHVLTAAADRYTPVDSTLIPTGEILSVKGTPFDFVVPKAIGAAGFDYDHNLVLSKPYGQFGKAITLADPESGRTMEVWTTEPGVQFYSGNFLDGSIVGKGDTAYHKYSGLCLECQHFPDSVNQPGFPSILVRASSRYEQITEYRFIEGVV